MAGWNIIILVLEGESRLGIQEKNVGATFSHGTRFRRSDHRAGEPITMESHDTGAVGRYFTGVQSFLIYQSHLKIGIPSSRRLGQIDCAPPRWRERFRE